MSSGVSNRVAYVAHVFQQLLQLLAQHPLLSLPQLQNLSFLLCSSFGLFFSLMLLLRYQ